MRVDSEGETIVEEQTFRTTPDTSEEAPRAARLGCKRYIDTILAVLVALYSLLTAGTGYAASIADGNQEESYFEGLSRLNDANFFYARANQNTQIDYQLWGDMNIEWARAEAEGQPEYMMTIIFENLYSQLSPPAQSCFDRWDPASSESPFDEQYFSEMYAVAEMNQQEADEAFEVARLYGTLNNRFELVVLMLTVGLSFTAWASVSQRDFLRLVFAIGAVAVLVVDVCALIVIGASII